MSNFDDLFTATREDVANLDLAVETAIKVSHAKSPEDCMAIETAVLRTAEFYEPLSNDQSAVDAIAARALQLRG